LLVLALGCEPAPPPPAPPAPPSAPPAPPSASPTSSAPPASIASIAKTPATPLFASYTGPSRFKEGTRQTIEVTLRNDGTAPETLNLFVLSVPQLALEVRDAGDHVMPPMPPPFPPQDMETAALAPGATRTFTISLDAFSPPLPKGHYNVRLRDPRAYGMPLSFVVE
jgi:hypothetical protein